jgi:hypothetical protein
VLYRKEISIIVWFGLKLGCGVELFSSVLINIKKNGWVWFTAAV